jgi:phospholipase C
MRHLGRLTIGLFLVVGSIGLIVGPSQRRAAAASPIQHVFFIVLENRTFDNVLGYLCHLRATDPATYPGAACDGATSGKISTGATVDLVAEPDLRPDINHSHESQVKAMDGGKMDRFDQVLGCNSTDSPCMSQFKPDASGAIPIPNVWNYAQRYAISDMTFEPYTSSSWGAHMEVAAGTLEQWHGNNPRTSPYHQAGKGWGCNSYKDAPWDTSPTTFIQLPACIPDQQGNGPYRSTSAYYTPTIMDRLTGAGLSWKIYVQSLNSAWSICATFYECYAPESVNKTHIRNPSNLPTDAANGNLPNFAFVIPKNFNSMHPSFSASAGDNWLASIVDPLMTGPDADSTAVFVTWDDCACIYDHVNPLQYNSRWGPRLPLLIISPYARQGFVDHTPTTFSGVLAYVEHNFGLAPLADQDGAAYNAADTGAWYATAFDYGQQPLAPPAATTSRVSAAEVRRIGTLSHKWVAD